ncbi:MAG: transglycosylase family protein [Acidimicrobiales bacterium]
MICLTATLVLLAGGANTTAVTIATSGVRAVRTPRVSAPTTTVAPAPSTVATTTVPPSEPLEVAADPVLSSAAAWAASPGVACIRDHESGDDYAEDTGNGYYGAYQDLLSTWTSHGGTGLPNDAPQSVQDEVNYEIWLTGGWGQWSTAPGCGL